MLKKANVDDITKSLAHLMDAYLLQLVYPNIPQRLSIQVVPTEPMRTQEDTTTGDWKDDELRSLALDPILFGLRESIKAFGFHINRLGGHALMKNVYDKMVDKYKGMQFPSEPVAVISHAWSGIGSWKHWEDR